MSNLPKKLILIGFILLAILGCSVKKNVSLNMESSYLQFRARQQSFQSSDGAIKYIDKGKGEVILLLHGIPTSSWLYRKMIDDLVNGGYRVIAPDMLGFGASDNPNGYSIYSPEEHAKRIIELMDHLKISKWNHVMHDAGGLWTWELFRKSPNRVKKLILLNTIVFEEGFKPPIRMKKGPIAKFSMWLYRRKSSRKILLGQLFKKGLNTNTLTESEIEGYKLPLKEGRTKGMYQFFSNTCNTFPNNDSIIDQINIPTAVIWGKNDDMLQLEPQKDKILRALKVIPKDMHLIDAKHFIQEEKPKEICTIILSFLKN